MSPRYFVEVRRTPGGPAPEETARALDESRRILDATGRVAAAAGSPRRAPNSSSTRASARL